MDCYAWPDRASKRKPSRLSPPTNQTARSALATRHLRTSGGSDGLVESASWKNLALLSLGSFIQMPVRPTTNRADAGTTAARTFAGTGRSDRRTPNTTSPQEARMTRPTTPRNSRITLLRLEKGRTGAKRFPPTSTTHQMARGTREESQAVIRPRGYGDDTLE